MAIPIVLELYRATGEPTFERRNFIGSCDRHSASSCAGAGASQVAPGEGQVWMLPPPTWTKLECVWMLIPTPTPLSTSCVCITLRNVELPYDKDGWSSL